MQHTKTADVVAGALAHCMSAAWQGVATGKPGRGGLGHDRTRRIRVTISWFLSNPVIRAQVNRLVKIGAKRI
jgi:hypothetical protein